MVEIVCWKSTTKFLPLSQIQSKFQTISKTFESLEWHALNLFYGFETGIQPILMGASVQSFTETVPMISRNSYGITDLHVDFLSIRSLVTENRDLIVVSLATVIINIVEWRERAAPV